MCFLGNAQAYATFLKEHTQYWFQFYQYAAYICQYTQHAALTSESEC